MPKNVNAVLTFIFKWWHQFIYIKRKKASQSWKGKVILNCFIMDFHNINPMLRSGISKLFKSTSRYFSVARVLLLSMSTFPVVPPFIGNCSLPPLLKGKKESLAGSGGFHCLPPAAPEPVKACWLSAQSPISIARPWGRLRCRGTWGKMHNASAAAARSCAYLGDRLTEATSLGQECIQPGTRTAQIAMCSGPSTARVPAPHW